MYMYTQLYTNTYCNDTTLTRISGVNITSHAAETPGRYYVTGRFRHNGRRYVTSQAAGIQYCSYVTCCGKTRLVLRHMLLEHQTGVTSQIAATPDRR